MKPLLVIMNPRRIEECLTKLKALDIDKAWLTGYTEFGLISPFNQLIEETDYTHYLVISDDGYCTQEALDAVLALGSECPVATGYCRFDSTHETVNLCRSPIDIDHWPDVEDFYTYVEVQAEIGQERHVAPEDEVRKDASPFGSPRATALTTYFSGMCLTMMAREMWQLFPFDCLDGPPGNGSDLSLCLRLQEAGIPILAAPEGYVTHIKEEWNVPDKAHDKRLLIGEIPAEVRLDPRVKGVVK